MCWIKSISSHLEQSLADRQSLLPKRDEPGQIEFRLQERKPQQPRLVMVEAVVVIVVGRRNTNAKPLEPCLQCSQSNLFNSSCMRLASTVLAISWKAFEDRDSGFVSTRDTPLSDAESIFGPMGIPPRNGTPTSFQPISFRLLTGRFRICRRRLAGEDAHIFNDVKHKHAHPLRESDRFPYYCAREL